MADSNADHSVIKSQLVPNVFPVLLKDQIPMIVLF